MHKENIHTDQAPAAIGPYTQVVRIGNLVYTAGQGGLDPATGKLVEGGVEPQARQTMRNLAAVLEAASSSFENVIKTTIFLRYIKDFSAVNEVYASFFEGTLPARSTVAVSALPMAALVEIEMVALVIESHLAPEAETQPMATQSAEETDLAETIEDPKKEEKTEKPPKSKKGKKKKKKKKKPKGKAKKQAC